MYSPSPAIRRDQFAAIPELPVEWRDVRTEGDRCIKLVSVNLLCEQVCVCVNPKKLANSRYDIA